MPLTRLNSLLLTEDEKPCRRGYTRVEEEETKDRKVLVHELNGNQTMLMRESELNMRNFSEFPFECSIVFHHFDGNLDSAGLLSRIPIPICKELIEIELAMGDTANTRSLEWYASVHLKSSVRLQRLFGRYKSLYVTTK